MKNMNKKQKIKINLSLDPDFFDIISRRARKNYVSTSNYIRHYLMSNILENKSKGNDINDAD
jgi:hypothetical protein